MKWRSEPNNWIRSKIRFALTYQERDVYHCFRSYCGQNDTAYIERSEGIAYSLSDLSAIIGESQEIIKSTIDKLLNINAIEFKNGIIHIIGWEDEQIPPSNSKSHYKNQSPEERELHEKLQLERLSEKYPDVVNKKATERIVELFNDGKIEYKPLQEVRQC